MSAEELVKTQVIRPALLVKYILSLLVPMIVDVYPVINQHEIMIMTKFGQYFGQIWPCLGQNLSKLIFHQTFGLMGVDLKFQIFLKFF